MLLELCGIRRVYPEFALEASFAVARGEFFSILGPSGSGKTTLLRLIAGFDRPDEGRLLLAGRDITRLPPHRRRIGMVFQDYALFPHLSVGENVAYGLKMQGLPAGSAPQKGGRALGPDRPGWFLPPGPLLPLRRGATTSGPGQGPGPRAFGAPL